MHIAEGYLPPLHALAWTAVAAPFVVHGARAVVRQVREEPETRLLLGAAGAFSFVLSALKLPSVTGCRQRVRGYPRMQTLAAPRCPRNHCGQKYQLCYRGHPGHAAVC